MPSPRPVYPGQQTLGRNVRFAPDFVCFTSGEKTEGKDWLGAGLGSGDCEGGGCGSVSVVNGSHGTNRRGLPHRRAAMPTLERRDASSLVR